jgi:hypothetical protein
MMKRYINMPQKALPLLFIGVLLLSSTTGCLDLFTKRNDYSSTYHAETYQNHSIALERRTYDGGRREDLGDVDGNRGGTWTTTYNQEEKVTLIKLTYPDGSVKPIPIDPPVWVKGDFFTPGHWLVDHAAPPSSLPASPPVLPLTPESGFGDNAQTGGTTPEQPTDGGHSHIEGGV